MSRLGSKCWLLRVRASHIYLFIYFYRNRYILWCVQHTPSLLSRSLTQQSYFVSLSHRSTIFLGNKSWDGDSVRTITAIWPTSDGEEHILTLNSAITRSLPGLRSVVGESVFAVEVASLSRNVVFTSENNDPEGSHIGGHFMVGWTPAVEQLVAGVRIENFGQAGNIGESCMRCSMTRQNISGIILVTNTISFLVFA